MFDNAPDRMLIRRTAIVSLIALAALTGGTFAAVKLATDHLLYREATSAAQNWARYLGENVHDLEQIAAGEPPSSHSIGFFHFAQRAGFVFRYEIFNRDGYSQMVSDRGQTLLVDLSEFSPAAALSVKNGKPIVAVKEGDAVDRPSFFAEAYVPVMAGDRPIAVVAAYVDQAEQRDWFFRTFLLAAVSLCLLTALSFAMPAVAWYRRTKEKEKADEEIHFLASHDPLTRLVNRAHLSETLLEALTRAQATGGRLAIHFVDIDHFKEVNDTLGHHSGDLLLTLTAERLCAATRHGDIVARLGGDEFAIVQCDILARSDAADLAQRLLAVLAKPFVLNGYDVAATASIGIAIAPLDGTEPDRLFNNADLALYRSKADGRNVFRFFTPEMDTELQARLRLEKTVRDAVQHDSFEVHFQPLVAAHQGEVTGFEALLRLRNEDGSLMAPGVFIPVAEEMGLISRIGASVLRTACRTAAQWPSHLTIAVNLSPAQFKAGDLCETVAAALAEAGLPANRLELEVTESLLLEDTTANLSELGRLKALGVSIVMDDFGTGYSSLSYLWRFPFDKIKIDRAFMGSLDAADKSVETIVKTIVGLGHSLHMRVTIEGVEDAEQIEFIREVACDEVQGFYYGRPTPAADIPARMLRDFQRRLATADRPGEQKLRITS